MESPKMCRVWKDFIEVAEAVILCRSHDIVQYIQLDGEMVNIKPDEWNRGLDRARQHFEDIEDYENALIARDLIRSL